MSGRAQAADRHRRRWRAAGAALVCCALLLLGAAPRSVAAPSGDAGEVTMQVDALTGTLRPGQEFRVQLRVRNSGELPAEGVRVVGTLHRKAPSRWAFQQALEEGQVSSVVLDSFSADVDPVPAGGGVTVELTEPAASLGFAFAGEDLFGVYPVRLQLQQLGEVLDEAFTALVFTPEQVDSPVRVAFLLPLDHPPARLVDGSWAGGDRLSEALEPGGRLDGLVRALEVPGALPVTVASNGLLLEQVAELAAEAGGEGWPAQRFLERVRAFAQRASAEQLALPYGAADIVALVRGDMAAEAVRHLEEGWSSAARMTGAPVSQGLLLPPEGVDAATLGHALAAGADTVVLGEDHLEVPELHASSVSPAPVRRLSWVGGDLEALVPDPWLERVLRRTVLDERGVLGAQRVLAETAVVYFERPYAAEPRGLLLASPRLWDPPTSLPTALLAALGDAPWIQPASLASLAASVAPEPGTVRLDYTDDARAVELPDDYLGALQEARRRLGSLATVLPETDPSPGSFDRLLRTAASAHYRDPELIGEGRAMIRHVARTVAEVYDAVSVIEGGQVILASDEGEIPVTIRNDAPVPLEVRVRLQATRYEFEGGPVRDLTLAPESDVTLMFRVHALAPGGIWPIPVIVEDRDGVLSLAEGRVVVRSTAQSVVALVVTGGAALFLLGWWLRNRRGALVATRRERVSAA